MTTTEGMAHPRGRIVLIGLAGWLSMLGFDFFLHAGLLAGLYLQPGPFLLPPWEAFTRIPLGYLSFLILLLLLLWLMLRLNVSGWRDGFVFGLKLGGLIWAALTLGLVSISTADPGLLFAWFVGQSLELGIAGAVAGAGMGGTRPGRLFLWVVAFLLVAVVVTVILQSVGLAPAAKVGEIEADSRLNDRLDRRKTRTYNDDLDAHLALAVRPL